MKEISGPFYHLDEAQEILGLRKSELIHLIRENEIQCVVYTKARNMLLFRRDKDSKWIGMAKCLYRGHMTIHQSYVEQMLDGEKASIGTGYGSLLEENGVLDWRSEYPFKKSTPHGLIKSWIDVERDRFKLSLLSATPFPRETLSFAKSIENIVDVFTTKPKPTAPGTIQISTPDWDTPDDQILDFKTNSTFQPEDLRIPSSELTTYQNETTDNIQTHQEINPMPKEESTRENQLHTLIERLLDINPNISAKQAWSAIEQDWEQDEQELDKDHIIQSIDAQCLEWKSRYGKERSISWASFQTQLSKLKKKQALS